MTPAKYTSANLLTTPHYRHHWQKLGFYQAGTKAVERAFLLWNPSVLSPQWTFLIHCSSEHSFSASKHHFVGVIRALWLVRALSEQVLRGKIQQCAWCFLKSYTHMEIHASLKTLLRWLFLRNCLMAFLVESSFSIGKREKVVEWKSHFFFKIKCSIKDKAMIWKGKRAQQIAYANKPDVSGTWAYYCLQIFS